MATNVNFSKADSALHIVQTVKDDGASPMLKVPVTINEKDPAILNKIFESNIVRDWAEQFVKNKDYVLKEVQIQRVEMKEGRIGSLGISFKTTFQLDESVSETTSVTLKGRSTALLMLLRDKDAKKEHLVFVTERKPVLGNSNYLSIPTGVFNEEGKLEGGNISEIEELLGVTFEKNVCVNLTQEAYHMPHTGLATDDGGFETVDVYIFRKALLSKDLQTLQSEIKKRSDAGQKINISLMPLNNSWSATTDAKSIYAIFLLHELRHHNRMPNLIKDVKKPPQFAQIGNLNPYATGANLLVKVLSAPEETERSKTEGSKIKEAFAVVGDNSGIVKLKLVNEQINDITEGTKMIIQNAKIDMVDNHMILAVDQWGKMTFDATALEGYDFNFEINQTKDLSSQEYELVVCQENGQQGNNRGEPNMRERGRGRGRGHIRGRGVRK